ncbi:cytochrome b/b6 domain-containing protein [Pantoea sp. B65]|uniref:cytochrome b/b6 domain-containing protein n=1 Tax=Pantoea sp. B65 TaxID=2813359 RepID=UPI0039B56189
MKSQLLNFGPHADHKVFRYLHILVALLILAQILNSNLTEVDALGKHSLTGIITWVHIISGFSLIFCGLFMLAWMLTQRGFRFYYSWLCLDFRAIRQDINTILDCELPEAHAGGIAASVQGMGVITLLVVAACGGAWFWLNSLQSPLAESILLWHKFLTLFIEIYFYSHGAMGIIHLILNRRGSKSQA